MSIDHAGQRHFMNVALTSRTTGHQPMETPVTPKFRAVNWRVFTLLLGAGLLGAASIVPYMLELLNSSVVAASPPSGIPSALIVPLALLQNGILLAIAILIGLVLSARVGLRAPLIRAWANGDHPQIPKSIVLPGVLVGAAVGVTLVTIEAVFFLRGLPPAMHPSFLIPLWKRLLAGVVYGGITEELFMRLFLLSLVSWLLARRWKTEEGMPTAGAFWAAIVIVAVLFGLGHLPATSMMTPLTTTLVVRALTLNGVAGVAFGYLYWKRGLEAAMLGHMSAHVIMQIPGIVLLRTML